MPSEPHNAPAALASPGRYVFCLNYQAPTTNYNFRFAVLPFLMPTAVIKHPLKLAKRMQRLGTETAFEVLVRARALEAKGKDIVHLEIGEPDFDTPANVVEAGVQALHQGWTHYGPSAGLPALREAVAEDAGRRRGIEIDPSEVVIVPGGKPIIF